MSIASTLTRRKAATPFRQPNEVDLKRVERAVADRTRYRYVHPSVEPFGQGYQIRSACCSRKVDPDGGEVDIARLQWDDRGNEWSLLRKDHASGSWIEDGRFTRLPEALLRITHDPQKRFWQ